MKKISKKIAKIITPLTICAGCSALIPVTSCGAMHSGVTHLAPYLHEMTFNDYTYDSEFVTTKDAEAFGCSSVRNGDFYGRNFDYVLNDTPEFVVRVNANEQKHRHASIGIATHFGLRETKLLNNEYKEQLDLVPNVTLDGINDAGVICSHNVVSMEPGINEGTNPGAEKLHMLFIPRFVLDNASSAQEAVNLIKQRDIVGDLGGNHYLHVMIADANSTCVVEFFDKDNNGHFDVVEDWKSGKDRIMTNYYVNNKDAGTKEDRYFTNNKKMGDERYEILKDGYDTSDSFAGMEALMKRVVYSNAYRFLHDLEPMRGTSGQATKLNLKSEWYSEYFDKNILYSGTFKPEDYVESAKNLKIDYWISRLMDYRNPPNPIFWQTTHNSTYDMSTKHLRVVVQEQYEQYFDYYL